MGKSEWVNNIFYYQAIQHQKIPQFIYKFSKEWQIKNIKN